MDHSTWVESAAGFRGPRYLVILIESEMQSRLAAEREGFAMGEYANPLILSLFAVELIRAAGSHVVERAGRVKAFRRQPSRLSPWWYS